MDVWKIVAIVNGVIALFCALTCFSAWLSGYEAGKNRAVHHGSGIRTQEFAEVLARIMDVQADGGDSPAAYVHWAIGQAHREYLAGPFATQEKGNG